MDNRAMRCKTEERESIRVCIVKKSAGEVEREFKVGEETRYHCQRGVWKIALR